MFRKSVIFCSFSFEVKFYAQYANFFKSLVWRIFDGKTLLQKAYPFFSFKLYLANQMEVLIFLV